MLRVRQQAQAQAGGLGLCKGSGTMVWARAQVVGHVPVSAVAPHTSWLAKGDTETCSVARDLLWLLYICVSAKVMCWLVLCVFHARW